MTTAIIGIGSIGWRLARTLVVGGARVILAARDQTAAATLAERLGPPASASPIRDALAEADVVVFTLRVQDMRQLMAEHADLLGEKVVIDSCEPAEDDGYGGPDRRPWMTRTWAR